MSEPQLVKDPGEDDGGAVGRLGRFLFGPSYRTSIAGYVTTGCAVVVGVGTMAPTLIPHPLMVFCAVVGPIAGGAGLVVAKDNRVSGRPK